MSKFASNKPKLGLIDALDVHSWLVFVFVFVIVKLQTVCKKGFFFAFITEEILLLDNFYNF